MKLIIITVIAKVALITFVIARKVVTKKMAEAEVKRKKELEAKYGKIISKVFKNKITNKPFTKRRDIVNRHILNKYSLFGPKTEARSRA